MTLRHFVPPAVLTLSVLAGCLSSTSAAERPTQATATQVTPPAQATLAQGPPPNQVATEMVEFVARVGAYHTLREQLTAAAPTLSDKPTPEELDAYQRALVALIVAARTAAKPGDMFVPDMQAVVRSLMARVFNSPAQRADQKAAMVEENLAGVIVLVNTRYPDGVPLATMPPEVLKNLPHLPKDCEYRFVGESLILLDTRAHLVVDVMSLASP